MSKLDTLMVLVLSLVLVSSGLVLAAIPSQDEIKASILAMHTVSKQVENSSKVALK